MREIGDIGQCEAIDMVPTEDDAVAVRCRKSGVVILERFPLGGLRIRCVCPAHGLSTAPRRNHADA